MRMVTHHLQKTPRYIRGLELRQLSLSLKALNRKSTSFFEYEVLQIHQNAWLHLEIRARQGWAVIRVRNQ